MMSRPSTRPSTRRWNGREAAADRPCIEAKTMRMLGHAIHDGAEYVPAELLAEWETRDPVVRYGVRLIAEGVADPIELDEIGERCAVEVEDAVTFAEASPWPEPATITTGVYAP